MKRGVLVLGCVFLASAWCLAADRADILVADFEGETYGDWTVEGEAFGRGPARGALPGQMSVAGFEGKGLVNSFTGGDDSTGRLLSPTFRIERPYLNLLVGGGKHPDKACVNLLLDGLAVRTVTGPNGQAGGSEQLDWHSWDVQDLAGKDVRVEILDQQKGGWGHINVDHITQSDHRKDAVLLDQTRTFRLNKRYLTLPVKTGGPKRKMTVAVAGRTVREFEIELADGAPDFSVFMDVNAYKGEDAVLKVDRVAEGSKGLDSILQFDDNIGGSLYREAHRPQFHFTARRGWLNDPNGLVYHNGEYHLYYQHNPYGWAWGNMHWGHAVSKDLLHWQELPIAVYPKGLGDMAFSGSAAVDHWNTGGFQKGSAAPIIAAFTSTGRGECILFSNDSGRSFEEYAGNPVLKHEGRDPKIFWYAPGKHWVMVVYSVRDKKNGLLFLTSPDLKKWTERQWLDGYFECPELFELPVDGKAADTRWVVYGADGSYALGKFDGKVFTPETTKLPANWGNCFYASQTYNDIPASDGRRIRVGWGTVAIPGMPFNQMMNLPVELTLRDTGSGIRMFAKPIRELDKLRTKKHAFPTGDLKPGQNPLSALRGDLWDVELDLTPGTASRAGFRIRGVPVVWDASAGTLTCNGKTAPLPAVGGRVRLRLVVDRTSIEIFGNDGAIYMPIGVIPKDDDRTLEVFSEGGSAMVSALTAYELRSVWR